MTSERDWLKILTEAGMKPQELLDNAQRWHHNFLLKAFPLILLILVLGVGLNAADWKEINFLFALIALFAGLYFATQPKIMLSVFAVGTLWNGVFDPATRGIKASLDEGVQFVSDKYVRPVGHILLLATVLFVFLGTFPIKNPLAIGPLIVIVMGLGLWAALFASNTLWYRRTTLTILLLAGAASLFGAYFYTLSQTEKLAEQVRTMSDTNLDRRNAGQIEALREYVAEGGILSPEQRDLLDQKTIEVSPGIFSRILPEGKISQFRSMADLTSTTPGKAVEKWLGAGWANWVLWGTLFVFLIWLFFYIFNRSGSQAGSNSPRVISNYLGKIITNLVMLAIAAVIIVMAYNSLDKEEDAEENLKPVDGEVALKPLGGEVADMRGLLKGDTAFVNINPEEAFLIRYSEVKVYSEFVTWGCLMVVKPYGLNFVKFKAQKGFWTPENEMVVLEEHLALIKQHKMIRVRVTLHSAPLGITLDCPQQ